MGPEKINVEGLVGIEYCAPEQMKDPLVACDCWALARLVLARACIELPADPAMCLAREGELGDVVTGLPRAGDVVVLKDGEGGQHIGVCIDRFSVIHQTKFSSRVDRLDVLERTGLVIRRVRPREQASGVAV